MIMVQAVKWVDEVIPDAPYAITEDFMKKLFDEYNIDYIIHGDDPCLLPDGTDAYALAKRAGRFKQIKRTEGVSSTDIVGRNSILKLEFVITFCIWYIMVLLTGFGAVNKNINPKAFNSIWSQLYKPKQISAIANMDCTLITYLL